MILSLGRAWARALLWWGLDGLFVEGLEEARAVLARGPVVLAANHVGFWDALLVVELGRRLGGRHQVLIDAARLRQLPFFRGFGAVGLDRSSALAARAGLNRAATALAGPGDVLWVFPQGRYRPPHLRPLGLHPGVTWISRKAGAALVPVSLTYPFLEGASPAAFVRFGEPVPADLAALEGGLAAGIDALDRRADAQVAAMVPAPPGLWSRALGVLWSAFGGDRG